MSNRFFISSLLHLTWMIALLLAIGMHSPSLALLMITFVVPLGIAFRHYSNPHSILIESALLSYFAVIVVASILSAGYSFYFVFIDPTDVFLIPARGGWNSVVTGGFVGGMSGFVLGGIVPVSFLILVGTWKLLGLSSETVKPLNRRFVPPSKTANTNDG